jgi:hypothetical protein
MPWCIAMVHCECYLYGATDGFNPGEIRSIEYAQDNLVQACTVVSIGACVWHRRGYDGRQKGTVCDTYRLCPSIVLKHTKASFSPYSIDSLCLQVAQVPKSWNMVIFVSTDTVRQRDRSRQTNRLLYHLLRMRTRGVNIDGSTLWTV